MSDKFGPENASFKALIKQYVFWYKNEVLDIKDEITFLKKSKISLHPLGAEFLELKNLNVPKNSKRPIELTAICEILLENESLLPYEVFSLAIRLSQIIPKNLSSYEGELNSQKSLNKNNMFEIKYVFPYIDQILENTKSFNYKDVLKEMATDSKIERFNRKQLFGNKIEKVDYDLNQEKIYFEILDNSHPINIEYAIRALRTAISKFKKKM